MMSELLNDPFLQSSLWPLLASAVVVGGLGMLAGRRSARLAAAGMGFGFIALYLLVIGLPALPPPASTGKLFWAAVAGIALGLLLDIGRVGDRPGRVLLGLGMVASVGWIAAPLLAAGNQLSLIGLMALIGVVPALLPDNGGDDQRQTVLLPYGALGLGAGIAVGATALIGSSASLAQLGLGLAAIAGGFLIWNWPAPRHVWGLSARVALGLPVLVATVLVLFSRAGTGWLLLALLAIPVAVIAARKVSFPRTSPMADAVRGAAITVAVLVMPLASVLLTWLFAASSASPY